ncbi:hypothetical protein B0H11DRAFT_78541 [Mycena galericulata]|nr:hypothetical protein B0H11DRAFT_78541 [Mycena galericulata]
MAVSHHIALYSSPHGGIDMSNDRNAPYHSPQIYGGTVGGSIYRYDRFHPHGTSTDVPPEPPLHYYTQVPNIALNLSHTLEGSAPIRQPTLPRLQIPSPHAAGSSSPPSSQRTGASPPTFHSATATATQSRSSPKFHPPPYRGPLSAPDASEDLRYHQLYEEPLRPSAMPVASSAGGKSKAVTSAGETSAERRSISPTRPTRRTTTTAVIACRQCRSRKIRCDSRRPHCANCDRRNDQCEYDPAPKRRGPDKKPGTRQRRCKKRVEEPEGEELPLRRPMARLEPSPSTPTPMIALPSPAPMSSPETASASEQLGSADDGERPAKRQKVLRRDLGSQRLDQPQQLSPPPIASSQTYSRAIRPLLQLPPQPNSPSTEHEPLRISTDDAVLLRHTQPPSSQPPSSRVSTRYASSSPFAYDVSPFGAPGGYDLGQQHSAIERDHPKFPSPPSAAVQAAQQGWWDAFLRSYSLREIATDLNFLHNEAPPFSFVNVRFLLETLWSPTKYLTLQPAFILASMALAVLIRSSEAERGAAGRERAAFLRLSAQDALERAWREGSWLDASLAEAALIIVLYESSAHPEYHPDRLARAFRFLDEVITALGLATLDAGNPDVCRYAHDAVPVVEVRAGGAQCGCIPPGSPAPDRDSIWSSALPWDPSWTPYQIRDEECRRVCWSALCLATSFRAECMALARPDECAGLRLCDPASYLVLFPNEMYDRGGFGSAQFDGVGGGTHPKNAIWALYCRSMLLVNFCSNVVTQDAETREDRESQGEALQESWNETQAIQDSLDAHVCNLHTAVAYQCRENVYNAQMIITKGLRNLQGLPAGNRPGPLFNRRQAEEWVYYQAEVIKRVTMSIQFLADARGQQLTQRPFAVTWFYHQLAICLLLWENDTSLRDVLELAKSFLIPLDVMNSLWPCELIQLQYTALRKRLTAHCRSAGYEPPAPPTSHSLPVARRDA